MSPSPTRLSSLQVEFKVNGVKQNYAMKLGEGGEAFFVFETSANIPAGLQTSPVISPTASPASLSQEIVTEESDLQEPEPLDLASDGSRRRQRPKSALVEVHNIPVLGDGPRAQDDLGMFTCHKEYIMLIETQGELHQSRNHHRSGEQIPWETGRCQQTQPSLC